MARELDVALLMMASDSFDDEHTLTHIKKHMHTQAFKSEDLFFIFILESQKIFLSYP